MLDTKENTFVAGLRAAAKMADKRSERIKSNEMYPAYGLNSQTQALDDIAALTRFEIERLTHDQS